MSIPGSLNLPAITVCSNNAFVASRVQQQLSPQAQQALGHTFAARFGIVDPHIDMSSLPNQSFWELYGVLIPSVNETFVEYGYKLNYINCEDYINAMHFSEVTCFTFNSYSYMKQHGHLKASATGKNGGFSLVLDTMPDEYFMPSRSGIGFDIYIHNQNVFPNVDGHHFSVGPGQKTNVAITQKRNVRLSTPYFNEECVTSEDVRRSE